MESSTPTSGSTITASVTATVVSPGTPAPAVTSPIARPSTPPPAQQQQPVQPVARPPSVPVLQQQQPLQPIQQPISIPAAAQQSTPPLTQPSTTPSSGPQQGFQPATPTPTTPSAQSTVQPLSTPVAVANGTMETRVSRKGFFIRQCVLALELSELLGLPCSSDRTHPIFLVHLLSRITVLGRSLIGVISEIAGTASCGDISRSSCRNVSNGFQRRDSVNSAKFVAAASCATAANECPGQ